MLRRPGRELALGRLPRVRESHVLHVRRATLVRLRPIVRASGVPCRDPGRHDRTDRAGDDHSHGFARSRDALVMRLRYRSYVLVEELALDECTIHPTVGQAGACWWQLWFRVSREDKQQGEGTGPGQPIDMAVPVNPGGGYVEAGPGGKTWGFTSLGSGAWQIAPSINVLASLVAHPGDHPEASLWHQTPTIVEVPDGETWIKGAP
jgi:hypothetical protein